MNNIDKAKEIAQNAKDYFYHDEYECGLACALRMAKWKDEQFEDNKDEIKVDAKKELAWEIHKQIAHGAALDELDRYVCNICDF